MPEELWAKMKHLLPPRPEHPLGCHNPRVPDRAAMEAILLVLRNFQPYVGRLQYGPIPLERKMEKALYEKLKPHRVQ